MQEEKKLTGYPSIDKPWLKYYSEEAIHTPLPEMTMYQYAYENNKSHLNDTAFRYFGAKISYGAFFEGVKKAANAFHELGVREGNIVTIMSMHTPETIMAIYGLNYIGAVANMVYMTLSEPEILETLRNTESKALLVLDVALEKVRKIKDEISVPVFVLSVADSMPLPLKIGYALKNKPARDFPSFSTFLKGKTADAPLATNHAAPAVIVYTSGTTGEPKGVVLSSDSINALVAQIVWTDRNDRQGETVLHTIPAFLGFGLSMLHRYISMGMDIELSIRADTDYVGKKFQKVKPNRFVAGPPFVDGIMKYVHGNMSYCIEFTGGGASLSPDKEREFNDFLSSHGAKTKYLNGYGMTELCSAVTTNQKKAYKMGSLGIPLVYTVVKVIDNETQQELPYGEIGELCFCTPTMMTGYYKNSSATQKMIDTDEHGNRWLHTGDLGYVDEDGFIFIQSRLKRIYNTKAQDGHIYKIFCQRIEDFLEGQPYVDSCAVIVREDEERLNVPVAFVTCKPGVDRDKLPQRLADAARTELPEHSQPQVIYVIDTMPMTASGKVDYRALEREAQRIARRRE